MRDHHGHAGLGWWLVILLAGCGGAPVASEPPRSPSMVPASTEAAPGDVSTSSPGAAAVALGSVRLDESSCTLDEMPEALDAGGYVLRAVNATPDRAAFDIFRIGPGGSVEALVEHIAGERQRAEAGEPFAGPPPWADHVAGSGILSVGATEDLHLTLDGGTYAIVCLWNFVETPDPVRPFAVAGPIDILADHCAASDAHQLGYDLPGTADVRVTCDIAYKSVGGVDLTFDLYLPPLAGEEGPIPVIVLFHGNEEIEPMQPVEERWKTDMYRHGLVAAASGSAAVAFDMRGYRVADEQSVMDTQEDAVDLITYLAANGSDIGVDASRMCLWSTSGGGIPATWAALVAEPTPKCAVIFSGRPEAPGLEDASPLARLGAADPLPAFFFAYGATDSYARSALPGFVDAVDSARGTLVVREHPDGHGFEQGVDAEAAAIVTEALAFIREHIGN